MESVRETILAADDLERVKVPVPEWGVEVWVRTMPAGEREAYLRDVSLSAKEDGILMARLVAWAAVDIDGNRLFRPEDAPALTRKSHKVIERLFEAAAQLNLLRPADQEQEAKKS